MVELEHIKILSNIFIAFIGSGVLGKYHIYVCSIYNTIQIKMNIGMSVEKFWLPSW